MKKNKHITIYEVAHELGVSATTVSRALKDHHSIGKDTIKRVKKKALEMGYEPNAIASGLRNKKTKTIGVSVSYINRPFISSLISGVDEVASSYKYNVIISQSFDNYAKEIENVKTMFNNRVDGLIVSLSMETNKFDHFDPYLKMNYPLVFVDRIAYEIEADKVIIDNYKAAYEATKHLIEQGYLRIAHMAGEQQRHVYKQRLEGYLYALKEHGIEPDDDLIYVSKLGHEDGMKAARIFLGKDEKPDAVFAANDTSAIGFMKSAEEMGISIPQELGIVGFNNDLISSIVKPQLSTVDHPAVELGKKAAEIILDKILGKSMTTIPQTIIFPTRLIVRSSSMNKVKN